MPSSGLPRMVLFHFILCTMTPTPFARLNDTPMRRRSLIVSAFALAGSAGSLALTGCGGGSTSEAYLRVVNASVDFSTADVWLKGSKSIAGLANAGSLSNWVTLAAAAVQVELHASGSSTASLTETRTLTTDTYTSVIAYGSLASSMKFKFLEETNALPASGYAKVRLFQGASTLAGVDVYVSNATSLTGLTPTFSVTSLSELSDFVTVTANTYRIRATLRNDQSTVLFDHTGGVSLSSQSVVTLVVVPRATGSRPNITALAEQSNGVLLSNMLA